ncbi:hypothetical protein CONPUDRAFT_160727 [Coniophora puteana RWD-64-598 SS2]|uniref:Uncharacterized protein n=1 Tax=Coniophora puteana (strain RWD-64-598) TaxID=741705 RepID=R7SC83_CONPW|nr:uncharacterized protein CONPUDRAFT_160727 [Coniophora puteana RWD-64-598 SS2]EIW73776.1 hypothetical protein CONPUDRAFT_160727 [Coniophora puteana RWD-64-598 SS2]
MQQGTTREQAGDEQGRAGSGRATAAARRGAIGASGFDHSLASCFYLQSDQMR